MASSPDLSTSPASSGENTAALLFDDIWTRLRDCHHRALQELESKVSRLKKERCLDAQRLRAFYERHQQLKEKHKSLQDTVGLMEERLQTGPCGRCVSEERGKQAAWEEDLQQSRRLNVDLENEKSILQDENRRLGAELDKLKSFCPEPQGASSPEPEEGVIPDSPRLQSSWPAVNKLKRRKKDRPAKHGRHAETPLPRPHSVPSDVFVPNTCEMDAPQTPPKDVRLNLGAEEVAETCCLEPPGGMPLNTLTAADSQRNSPPPPKKSKIALSSTFQSKQTKEERRSAVEDTSSQKEQQTPGLQGAAEDERRGQETLFKHPSTPLRADESLSHEANVKGGKKRHPLKDHNPTVSTPPSPQAVLRPGQELANIQHLHAAGTVEKECVERMWSMDPAAAFSQYDALEEAPEPDTDSTFISHSLLQDAGHAMSGQKQKAGDSLDEMFDTTAYGEYRSQCVTHVETPPSGGEEDDHHEGLPPETPGADVEEQKTGAPTFAHVAVVRKKEERRKLKGTTCKECEVYYAHLPEEEREQKLSSCSRHRFLFLPPATPENFWEVGFPSTQTCVDRGYIKEDENPEPRVRRRLPYNALFSPKHNQHT